MLPARHKVPRGCNNWSHHSHSLQDAVGKIHALESDGRMSGVMDDRGRFIYISHEEMVAVAGDEPVFTHSLCWLLPCSPRVICTVQLAAQQRK